MKKTLRFIMAAMLALVANVAMAQTEVTIDFNENYATLFPTLAGTSSNDSHDGDFTEATTSAAVNGVTVTVSAADEGVSNANRIWSGNPRLRMYSGTLTIASAGEKITKMVITRSTNAGKVANNNTVDTGTLTTSDQQSNAVVEWAGEAQQVVMTIAGNTQFSKIVVTLGGDPGTVTPEDPNRKGTVTNPYSVEEAQALLATLGVNVKSDEVYVKGTISRVDEVSAQYGNATYYISDSGDEDGQLEIFRGKYLENTAFTAEDQIMVDDVVIVCGQLVNYRSTKAADDDPATPEMAQGNYIYELNGKTKVEGGETPTPVELSTCAQVIAGQDGTVYRVKGTCREIKNTTFGNWYLEDATGEVFIYGTLDKDGKTRNFASLGIEVGDVVTVEGPRSDYNGSIELVDVTVIAIEKGSQPNPGVELITVARALEIIDALENGATTTETYQVKGYVTAATDISTQYGNATFDIADAAGGTTVLTIFRAKGFNGQAIDADDYVKVGDEVVVEGKLQKYVKNDVVTPEMATGGTIISINGKTSKDEEQKPEVEEISVARAIEICSALADKATTAETYRVKGFVVGTPDFQRKADGSLYGNVNLDIADTKGGTDKLTVFRAKSFDGENFTEETTTLIKEGDEVVFEGKLQNYSGTPELATGGKLISVNGKTSGISQLTTATSTDATIYNLQGQRVEKAVRGLYIIGGRKVMVK